MTSKSLTTTEVARRPCIRARILAEEFMVPLDLSANALAARVGVPGNRNLHDRRGQSAA